MSTPKQQVVFIVNAQRTRTYRATLRREKNGQKVTAFVQEIDAGTIRSEGKRIVTHQNLFQDVGTDSTRVECPLRLLTKVREAVPP